MELILSDYVCIAAWLARKLYGEMRREDASIRIQKYTRAHAAQTAYKQLKASTIVIQTGLRAMAARNEFRHRRRTKGAISIQVRIKTCFIKSVYRYFLSTIVSILFDEFQTQWRLHKARWAYLKQKKAGLILQCLWRGRIARKELRSLRMVRWT